MFVSRKEQNFKELKNRLTDFYGLDFSLKKDKLPKKYTLRNYYDKSSTFYEGELNYEFCELLYHAMLICLDALGEFNKDIENLVKPGLFTLSEKLLMYVVMDTFMNLDSQIFFESCYNTDKKINKSCFTTLSRHFSKFNKDGKSRRNFFELHKTAKESYWFNELVNFGVVQDKPENTTEDNVISAENSTNTPEDIESPEENSQKKETDTGRGPNIMIPKYLENIIGLFTYTINKNPFRCFDNQYDTVTKKISTEVLFKYFCRSFNLLSKVNMNYNFFEADELERVKSFFVFDVFFDFDNIVYIDKKMNELFREDDYFKTEAKKVLYQCYLIPDVFGKTEYIDFIFDEYLIEDNEYYEDLSNEQILMEKFQKLKNTKELIMFLSKVYFPVLSACFYVLAHEKYGSEENAYKALSDFIKKEILEYYEKREELRERDNETQDYLLKNKNSCFAELYELIRNNIYSTEEQYKDIKASLTLFENNTPMMKKALFYTYMKTKVNDERQNLDDPIPYEKSSG